jgi:hypothetical protein
MRRVSRRSAVADNFELGPGTVCAQPGVRRWRTLAWLCLSALLSCPLSSARAQEGGIEVFAAETLFARGWRVSESYLYKRAGSFYRGSHAANDPKDRVLEEHRAVTGIDYGFFPGLTVSALIPVVYKRQKQRLTGSPRTLESFGAGDIAVLGKYRYFKRDWQRSAIHLAVITGLEVPSGDTGEDENGVRLPPNLQPGSGSWDPITALAANLELNRWRFDALALAKWNTEGAQDFEEGDFFALELDSAYRFWHTKYPGPTASAKLGIQWRHEESDRMDSRRLADSGLDELVLRAGLTFHPIPRMDLTLSADVPFYRDVKGEQLVREVRTFFGFGIRF